MSRWRVAFVLLSAVALALGAASPSPGRADPSSLRVLFIGNSYTRFNDLPRLVERIAESVEAGPAVVGRRETHGGFNLRRHWQIRRVRHRVSSGRWDAVVVQPHSLSPLAHRTEMEDYATRFATHAREAGAELVLFETWARHPRDREVFERFELDSEEAMQAQLTAVYGSLAERLEAPLAPVGRAWLSARREHPTMPLHRPDGTHPALAGSYLSACVLYGTLTGRDPREASYRPYPLSRRRARRIREIAAASL